MVIVPLRTPCFARRGHHPAAWKVLTPVATGWSQARINVRQVVRANVKVGVIDAIHFASPIWGRVAYHLFRRVPHGLVVWKDVYVDTARVPSPHEVHNMWARSCQRAWKVNLLYVILTWHVCSDAAHPHSLQPRPLWIGVSCPLVPATSPLCPHGIFFVHLPHRICFIVGQLPGPKVVCAAPHHIGEIGMSRSNLFPSASLEHLLILNGAGLAATAHPSPMCLVPEQI